MKKILITVVGLAIGFSFFSCSNKKKSDQITETPINIDIKDSAFSEETPHNQLWHAGNKKLYVLFGYNYNDAEFVSKATALLSETFGLYENGGVIIPIVFPDGFRHKDKAVTVDLLNYLNDETMDTLGFVSLGAPENTYRALTKLQDQWQTSSPFPVVSIFPQDDILGIEHTSSIVLNQIQNAESEENFITESENHTMADADILLKSVCEYLILLDGTPEKDASLAAHVKQMLPGRKIRRYTDSETGLYSINHFVIE